MKRLHIYFEKQETLEKIRESLHNLEQQGLEVCVHDLPMEFTRVLIDRESLVGIGLGDWKESLYLTDISQFAAVLRSGKYPVIAYMHEGNRESFFGGVKYIIEGFEDVTAEYFVRVWQRLVGLPWHILDTKRCSIRETTVEDVEAFYRIYSEPSITAYMEDLFADREEEKAYIETYIEKVYQFFGFGMWTVTLKESGEVIGRAGISMREGYETPELGFLIGVPWQGRGLAEEVCRGILKYAAEELEFDSIQALVKPQNAKSVGLLEKLDFRSEGEVTLPDGMYKLYMRTKETNETLK